MSETIGVERAHFMRAYEDIVNREKMRSMTQATDHKTNKEDRCL